MTLPSDFHFSQNNLQDYVDCPRHFELRHLQRLKWPSLQSEPVLEQERYMELGRRFHQMVHQSFLGIPEEQIRLTATDADLVRWWDNYQLSGIMDEIPPQRYPEFTLSTLFSAYRLVAKYDLLAVAPGDQIIILDWKTSRKKQSQAYLKNRMQTRVYPLLLVEAGSQLYGHQPIDPGIIRMTYWFPEEPEHPVRFQYNKQQYQSDQTYLTNLIAEIRDTPEGRFLLTTDVKHCLFCQYRSLCDRGIQAGNNADMENIEEETPPTESLLDTDFGQIGEIAY